MKIIKKLNPIQESISKIGETKKALKEEVDKNYKIGRVLDPAAADAVDLHREFRKQGLERQANPDKDPLVKEFIDETASAKSRTKHIDVVDRKELAKVLTEAKKNKQKFKVGKSDKLGYRYFVDIFPVYGSQGALDVIEDDAEGGEVDGGEMLGESLNKGEACFKKQDGVPGYLVNDEGKEKFLRNYSEKQVKDLGFKIKKDLKEALSVKPDILLDDILNWFDDHEQAKKDLITYLRRNNYKEEDIKDLFEIDEPLEEKQVKEPLKEKKYKTPMNETEDYINAMYRAYKALKSRKNGYAAVYGYRKGEKFIPLLSIKDSQTELNKVVDALKTKEKGKTDVTVYTLFKNNLDGAEDTLRSEGLLKESLKEDYGDFDYYKEQLDELDLDDTSYDYYLEALYEVADEDPYASYKSFADVLKDAISTSRQDMEEDEDENDGLDENPKESSNKDKIRLVIDLCIDTKNRRQMSVEGIREGVLVRYFDTKEQLRDYLLTEYYEDYDEFKQEMEDAEEIDYSDGKDHVDEEIEYILGTFDDPGDGSPNVQYISINGQPAFEEYTWTYDEINDSELLEKGSQREIQKRILDDILIDDEDEYEDDTDGDDLEKILKKDDLEKIRKQLKHGKDIV